MFGKSAKEECVLLQNYRRAIIGNELCLKGISEFTRIPNMRGSIGRNKGYLDAEYRNIAANQYSIPQIRLIK